jgi:hypothetical protein
VDQKPRKAYESTGGSLLLGERERIALGVGDRRSIATAQTRPLWPMSWSQINCS